MIRYQMFFGWLFALALMACIVTLSVNRKPPDFLEAASSPNLPGMMPASSIRSFQEVEPYSESIWNAVKPEEREAVERLMNETYAMRAIRRQLTHMLDAGQALDAMALVVDTYKVKHRIAQIAVEMVAQRNGIYINVKGK